MELSISGKSSIFSVIDSVLHLLIYSVFSFTNLSVLHVLIYYIQVVEENQDWNRCIDDNSLTLGRCVYNCQNNEQCEDDCLARFKTRQLDCPCEVILRKINPSEN